MTEMFTISLRALTYSQKGVKPVLLKKVASENLVPYLDIYALKSGLNREYTHPDLGNTADENDLLVVWDGSRSGYVFEGRPGVIGSTLMKLTPIEFNKEYLYYFIKSKFEYLNGNLTGGGIPHVNSELFYDLQVPYLPLPEQLDHVADLKRKITQSEALLNQQKKVIGNILTDENQGDVIEELNTSEAISNFKSSIAEKAISGELTQKWREIHKTKFPTESTKLGSVITNLSAGKSFRCLERPPTKTETGVAKISAVSIHGYLERESKTCLDKSKVNSELFIKPLDFLMTRANTKELVGLCAIVESVERNIMLSDKILRITFDETFVIPEFILIFLKSKSGRQQIENAATGSQESMKNITQGDIRGITLRLPSLEEQREIVKLTAEVMKIADSLMMQYITAVDEYQNLQRSILTQHFNTENLAKYQFSVNQKEMLTLILRKKFEFEQNQQLINKSRSKAKSSMKKSVTEVSTLDIEDVLRFNNERLAAREVWKASKYSQDIDSFYEAVKQKATKSLKWELTKPDEEVPESVIILNN